MGFKSRKAVAAVTTINPPTNGGRTFSGLAQPNGTVTLTATGVIGGTTIANAFGIWSFTFATAPAGRASVVATGTPSAAFYSVPPDIPVLTPLTLSAPSFTVGAPAGTIIGTLGGKTEGSTLTISPNDGRVALNSAQTALVIGLTASAAGVTGYTITESLAGATNTPLATSFSITAVAAASAGDPNRWMFASTRSTLPAYKAIPSDTQLTRVSKTVFTTPDYVTNDLRPVLQNWFITPAGETLPENDTGNPITINGLSLLIGSTYYPVRWGGATSVVIADGAVAVADALNVPGGVPARTTCYWVLSDSVTSGQFQPGGWDRQSNNGEIVSRTAAHVPGWLDGSVAVPVQVNTGGTQTGRPYGPTTVLAKGWDGRPVVALHGDSMGSAAIDIGNFTPASGVSGWLARGLDNPSGQRYPHCNFAVTGTRPSGMSNRNAGNGRRRFELIDACKAINPGGKTPFTAILSEHINNDASGAPVTATLQGLMDAFWARLRAEYPDAIIVQTAAMCATTTDTSQWSTLAGQSYRTADAPAVTGSRWAVSDAFIANPPAPLNAVIDQTPLIMDVASRKWKGRAFSATLTQDYASGLIVYMTAAPVVGEALVFDTGTANVTKPNIVSAVSGSGPYTVTMFSAPLRVSDNANAGHLAGSAVTASETTDGLHAPPIVHAELAQAIVDAKLASKFGAVDAKPVVVGTTVTLDPAVQTLAAYLAAGVPAGVGAIQLLPGNHGAPVINAARTSGTPLQIIGGAGVIIGRTTFSAAAYVGFYDCNWRGVNGAINTQGLVQTDANSHHITFGCLGHPNTFASADDISAWSNADLINLPYNTGLMMRGPNMTCDYNRFFNLRNCVYLNGDANSARYNRLDHFSWDGFDIAANNCTVSNNVIRDTIHKDGDTQHADCLQIFPGTWSNTTIKDNDFEQGPDCDYIQGINNFDATMNGVVISGNRVVTDSYNAIAIYGGDSIAISGNTILALNTTFAARPWIQIGPTKAPAVDPTNSSIANNMAPNVLFAATGVTVSGNKNAVGDTVPATAPGGGTPSFRADSTTVTADNTTARSDAG